MTKNSHEVSCSTCHFLPVHTGKAPCKDCRYCQTDYRPNWQLAEVFCRTEKQPIEYTGQYLTEADIGKTFFTYRKCVKVYRIVPHKPQEKISDGIIEEKK